MLNVTFTNDNQTKDFVLSLFNKTVNSDGLIVEESTNQPVLDMNGQEIAIDKFGMISNGSEIYVKDDIVSLVEFYQKQN